MRTRISKTPEGWQVHTVHAYRKRKVQHTRIVEDFRLLRLAQRISETAVRNRVVRLALEEGEIIRATSIKRRRYIPGGAR